MKKTKILISLMMFLMMTTLAWGVSNVTGKWQSPSTALFKDTDTRLDMNNLEMFVYNDGNFAYDNANVLGKTDGLYFPRGTKKTVIYSAGIWIGAKVGGDIRLAIAEYSSEFVPGPMLDGTYQPDNANFKVYKVERGDTPESNSDYANWPVADGAPVDEEGNPKILGDQMCWSVFNDADPAGHINDAAGTQPLGIEVQQSAFGFARGGALGNTLFLKYKIINKGTNTLDSTFVALWADPDLGDASDDLVGCDTTVSLGYCYNEGGDTDYGSKPPAVGFDFFEGPIVPSEGDSALVDGKWRQGFRNLPMYSFNKYINGTDPASRVETYGYMRGLTKDPNSQAMIPTVNPETGEVTTFAHSGDPVTQTGWRDESAADRRFMMSAGPFTMAPGDTQEVVAAVIVAQGADPLNSIIALKEVDRQAQIVFDLNFDIPSPPPPPNVYARPMDGAVELIWDDLPVGDVDSNATLNQEFHFEGFNLYQGEGPQGPWKKFATYDLSSEAWCGIDTTGEEPEDLMCPVALIYNDQVNPEAGGIQRVIVQQGSESGLDFQIRLTNSQIDGVPLLNNRPYYFGITSYSYDVRNITPFFDPNDNFLGFITESLESPIRPIEVRPLTWPGTYADTATHLGSSDGSVVIEYIYPDSITGHEYEVTFNEDDTWNLTDKTTGEVLLENQDNQVPGYEFPIVDGFMIRVMGPQLGVKRVQEVANGEGPLPAPDNVNYSLNSTGDWYIDPGSSGNLSRYTWNGATMNDYEIRWTANADSYCLDFFGADDGNYSGIAPFLVPIEFWDIGVGTPDDASDDRRIAVIVIDDDASNSFTWGDGLYIWDIDYDDVPWTQPGWHTGMIDPDYAGLHYGRIWFYNVTNDLERPDPGTIIRITTNKPNTTEDVFAFETTAPSDVNGTFVRQSLDDIKVWPNPYYAFNPEELDQFDRIMYFENVPPGKEMTFRIYNIAGDLVRTIVKPANNTTRFSWDLKTESGLWVASGIYIWVVEADGLGTKFGKMAVFPEVEQLDTY